MGTTALLSEIKKLSGHLLAEIIEVRRHLHMYPELSFEEAETSSWIARKLDAEGIAYTTGWAGYGLVAIIPGASETVVALRGDMDALPIEENNNVAYKSRHQGVMHACGHDVHTACLLGAAIILNRLRTYIPVTVKCIFQPGEEKLPGGAHLMIKEGVLHDPAPRCIVGQHVFPALEAGKIGIRSGLYMASSDEIYITVTGKGGHGATPQECIDPVLVASHLIVAMQQIVSRRGNVFIPSVLTFGKINTVGGATNIIPDTVKIEGTFRTMDETWRKEAHQLIRNLALNTCLSYGASCEVNIIHGYPCLINHPLLTENIKVKMETYVGKENVVELPQRMTSEDFAFYSQVIPACFYRLGTGNKAKGIVSPVHTPTFDIDESALEIGMGLMAWLAVSQDYDI